MKKIEVSLVNLRLEIVTEVLKLSELRRKEAMKLIEMIELEKMDNISEIERVAILDASDMARETGYGFGDLRRALDKLAMRSWPAKKEGQAIEAKDCVWEG